MTTSVETVERAWAAVDLAIAAAQRRVVVVSPWLSAGAVQAVVQVVPRSVSKRFVFRWPADPSEGKIVDPAALQLLLDDGWRVQFVPQETRLHAKVVLVDDDWALVGSANFTGRGLNLPGANDTNLELGVAVRGADAAPVARWVDALNAVDLDADGLALLQAWAVKWHLVWATLGASFAPPPDPPDRPQRATGFVEATLRRLGISATHVPEGAGKNCWDIGGPAGCEGRFKAHVSDSDSPGDELHFEVTERDLRKRDAGVVGVMYVAGQAHDRTYRPLPGWPAVVIVPFTSLIDDKHGLKAKAMKGHEKLKVIVRRDGAGYVLQIPRRGGKRDDLAEAPIVSIPGADSVLVLGVGAWRGSAAS